MICPMNCPNCGASTKFHDIDGFYDCGSVQLGIIRQEFNQSPGCKELCELRSKLSPEGAEPLKWIRIAKRRLSSNFPFGRLDIKWNNKGEFWLVGAFSGSYNTIDSAKAHAEELHQAAFAEFMKKWGRK